MNTNLKVVEQQKPREYTASQLQLVKRTVAADCNDLEFDLFVEVCKRVGLDPFRRQIYAIVYSKDNAEKRKMSIITGIDGFRAIADRNGNYRPDSDEADIVYKDELKNPDTNPLGIERAVYKAYKRDQRGEWFPVKATAYWEEFAAIEDEWAWNPDKGKRAPTGKQTLKGNWAKMPRVMISKCAEAQALRKGWPEDLSGIYSPEEMDRTIADATASEAVSEYEKEERIKRVGAKDCIPIIWGDGEGILMEPIGTVADKILEFVDRAKTVAEIEYFKSANQAGLQQFWAMHKADALDLKRGIEERAEKLQTINKPQTENAA